MGKTNQVTSDAPDVEYKKDGDGNIIYAPRGRITWDELWADADRLKKNNIK